MVTRIQRALTLSFLFLSTSLLAGCASGPVAPASSPGLALPHQVLVQNLNVDPPISEILIAQRVDDQQTRWTLLDLLGVPRARQYLEHGKWRNDGFMPPNPDASMLFAALVFAWTPEQDLSRRYAGYHVRVHPGSHGGIVRELRDDDDTLLYRIRWSDASHPDAMTVRTFSPKTHWRIDALSGSGSSP